jgi:MGT family glycosyltransferase
MQVVRDGGGTVQAELSVAAKLRARGHRVRLLGLPEVGAAARRADFPFDPLDPPPGDWAAGRLAVRMLKAAVPWARRLSELIREDRTDVLVADNLMFGALLAGELTGTPCAALLPTILYFSPSSRPLAAPLWASHDLVLEPPTWAANPRVLEVLNQARKELGLPEAASAIGEAVNADRLLVLSERAFESPFVEVPPNAEFVGPQAPRYLAPATAPHAPSPWATPPGETAPPLVLVSLSTTEQDQLNLLKRLLLAVAELPVRALFTLGPSISADLLDPPANAVLRQTVPHAEVMPYASVAVTHSGHGTVMAALTAGVPLVCVPGIGDQFAVAARVVHHGCGVAVDHEADTAQLAAAIRQVLENPEARRGAERMASAIAATDPDLVALRIEELAG